ncbi:hypothetical protein [Promicromonospora sp. NPDC057488]|uniref:hypothetical protein n=1 Tax=Promicromonospora sp. NPDC057488 TaxID=3346147 RepID=UPI00366FA9F0
MLDVVTRKAESRAEKIKQLLVGSNHQDPFRTDADPRCTDRDPVLHCCHPPLQIRTKTSGSAYAARGEIRLRPDGRCDGA